MFYIRSFSVGENLKTIDFSPAWLTGYSGFEVRPFIPGTWFSIGREGGYWHWNREKEKWDVCDEPRFESPDFIRDRINKLPPGKIYFQCNHPYPGKIRVGYYLSGSLLDYLLNFAIPTYIKRISVDIIRWIEVLDGQLEVGIPEGLEIGRIRKVQLLNFSHGYTSQFGIINEQTGGIIFANSLKHGDSRLILDYELDVISSVDREIYQISSLPCVAIIPIPNNSTKYDLRGYSEFIQSAQGVTQESTTTWQRDQVMELAVFSDSLEESRVIAGKIMNQVNSDSRIYLPPFDCWVYLRIGSPIEPEKQYSNIKGDVRTCKFELIISNLLEG